MSAPGIVRSPRSIGEGERGFTLTELLVTLAILGLVMAAVVTTYMTGTTIGLTGENKAEAQQGARAAMLMEEDLRLAGYGFPSTQTKITAATQTDITFWADLANASTMLDADLAAGNTALSVMNAAGIAAGDTIYLINGDQWEQLTVSGVNAAANTVTVAAGPTIAFPRGAQVGRPRAIRYLWDPATFTLWKDAGDGTGLLPLATDVQLLQFRYYDTSDVEIQPVNLAANLGNIRRIETTVTAQSGAAQNRGTFTMTSSVRPRNL